VDRLAIARAERRRQATDELEFERDRATALQEQVERIVLELEGPALDDEVFAKMDPEDVGRSREHDPAGSHVGLVNVDDRCGRRNRRRAVGGRPARGAGGGDRAAPG
jgi:hypothetical protein